jgi:hypothetical protein
MLPPVEAPVATCIEAVDGVSAARYVPLSLFGAAFHQWDAGGWSDQRNFGGQWDADAQSRMNGSSFGALL